MAKSESNSMRRELAAFAPIGDHPDPDVLAGFAEGSLLERERLAVMGHLAGCAECRAILSLAAEATPDTPELRPVPIRRVAQSPFRSWMLWGAVAAGIAIACTVALRYERSRTVLAPPVAQKSETPAKAAPEVAQLETPAATPESLQKKSATGAHSKPKQTVPSGVATAKAAPQQIQEQGQTEALQQDAAQASHGALGNQALTDRETQAADLRLAAPHVPAPSLSNTAAKKVVGGPQFTMLARAHWRINGQGQPERAFGGGPWQPILAFEGSKMLVLSIVNDQVWVGGESSRVYRSSDEGTTWQAVLLPIKNGSAHSIVHIRFETPQSGSVEAADGTAWQTTDGGNTWK